jgi:hypothetical protein
LPALIATTPRARALVSIDSRKLRAPRSLKDAVNCRFSNLRKRRQPSMADSVCASRQGVSEMCGAIAACARRTASAVTA